MSEAAASIGHNKAPLKELLQQQLDQLPELLAAETELLANRVKALIDAEARSPAKIEDGDEDTAAKVIAYAGQVQKAIKEAEALRVGLTEAPLAAQRTIMEHFRNTVFVKLGSDTADKKTNSFGGLRQRLSDTLTTYQQRKVAIERAQLEAEERKAREAAQAAERARLEVERIAREAAEAERRRQAEETARIESESDLQAAIEHEEREKQAAASRAEQARLAAEEAERRQAEAMAAAQAADAKASTLSRTSGLYGSSSSLRESWKARVDHDKVKTDPAAMAAIWEYLKPDDIDDAANRLAKLKKNTVKITGLEFYDSSRAQVRA